MEVINHSEGEVSVGIRFEQKRSARRFYHKAYRACMLVLPLLLYAYTSYSLLSNRLWAHHTRW
jgi:hypothetical protein